MCSLVLRQRSLIKNITLSSVINVALQKKAHFNAELDVSYAGQYTFSSDRYLFFNYFYRKYQRSRGYAEKVDLGKSQWDMVTKTARKKISK